MRFSKSAFAASGEGKIVAEAIVRYLRGEGPAAPTLGNLSYNIVAPDYGIAIKGTYRLGAGEIVKESSKEQPPPHSPAALRKLEAERADQWYRTITADVFG